MYQTIAYGRRCVGLLSDILDVPNIAQRAKVGLSVEVSRRVQGRRNVVYINIPAIPWHNKISLVTTGRSKCSIDRQTRAKINGEVFSLSLVTKVKMQGMHVADSTFCTVSRYRDCDYELAQPMCNQFDAFSIIIKRFIVDGSLDEINIRYVHVSIMLKAQIYTSISRTESVSVCIAIFFCFLSVQHVSQRNYVVPLTCVSFTRRLYGRVFLKFGRLARRRSRHYSPSSRGGRTSSILTELTEGDTRCRIPSSILPTFPRSAPNVSTHRLISIASDT